MKAISPVIATVIIVAVAIAISIAVALWITGIVGTMTNVENLQLVAAYAQKTGNGWSVTLVVRNTGTTDATIDNIFINGKPYSSYQGTTINMTLPYTLSAGNTLVLNITLSQNEFTSGQQVEIKLHSSSGREYPKTITLP